MVDAGDDWGKRQQQIFPRGTRRRLRTTPALSPFSVYRPVNLDQLCPGAQPNRHAAGRYPAATIHERFYIQVLANFMTSVEPGPACQSQHLV